LKEWGETNTLVTSTYRNRQQAQSVLSSPTTKKKQKNKTKQNKKKKPKKKKKEAIYKTWQFQFSGTWLDSK